jgi:hypothetical protein
MVFILREHDSDRILPGFAINSAGIKKIYWCSNYQDYARVELINKEFHLTTPYDMLELNTVHE